MPPPGAAPPTRPVLGWPPAAADAAGASSAAVSAWRLLLPRDSGAGNREGRTLSRACLTSLAATLMPRVPCRCGNRRLTSATSFLTPMPGDSEHTARTASSSVCTASPSSRSCPDAITPGVATSTPSGAASSTPSGAASSTPTEASAATAARHTRLCPPRQWSRWHTASQYTARRQPAHRCSAPGLSHSPHVLSPAALAPNTPPVAGRSMPFAPLLFRMWLVLARTVTRLRL